MATERILWRRLDSPGHDACRLLRLASGWRLEGCAAFRHEGGEPACVGYEVECDEAWRTHRGVVRGWVGATAVAMSFERVANSGWWRDGRLVPGLEGCVDLDLGFTPATNLFHLRRIALGVGQAADVAAAWVDVPGGSLEILRQRYERRSDTQYWYEAPDFEYSASLVVGASGFVEQYPGLWSAEPTPG